MRAATKRIRHGDLRKVVLARTIVVAADRELDPKQLLWRLRAVDPDCYAFATPEFALEHEEVVPTGVLVGATPELLVSKSGDHVAATPLAGSAPRYGDPAEDRGSADRLFDSTKDREEQRSSSRTSLARSARSASTSPGRRSRSSSAPRTCGTSPRRSEDG